MIPAMTVPKHNLTLSTGKIVQFRSFIVKEEKILLVAQQTGQPEDILLAIKEMVRACTDGQVNPDILSIVDFIWLLVNIRMKSVGESAKFRLSCKNSECKKGIEYSYDLSSVTMPDCAAAMKKKIKLNATTGVVLRMPTTKIASIALDKNIDKVTKQYFGYADCIDSIYSGNEVFSRPDTSDQEVFDFVESLTPEQMKDIKEYFDGCPKITKELSIKCPYCGTENKITLKGIFDFFV